MKKFIYALIFMLLILPFKVNALDVTPSITCDKTNLKVGEQAVCTFSVNVTNGKICAISSPYTYESEYAIVKVENQGNWQGNADGNRIDYYDFNNYQGNVQVSRIIYKVKEDAPVAGSHQSKLEILISEVSDENSVANHPNDKKAIAMFNISTKTSPTTKATTAKVTTASSKTTEKVTTKARTTTKRKKTTKKSSEPSVIESTTAHSTTTKTSSTTNVVSKHEFIQNRKTTHKTILKQESNNIIIFIILFLLLILLLIALIITIREEIKRRRENKEE